MEPLRSCIAEVAHTEKEDTLTDSIACEDSEIFKDQGSCSSIYDTNAKRQSCKQKELTKHDWHSGLAHISILHRANCIEEDDSDSIIHYTLSKKQTEKPGVLVIAYHRNGSDHICRAQHSTHHENIMRRKIHGNGLSSRVVSLPEEDAILSVATAHHPFGKGREYDKGRNGAENSK